MSKKVAIVLFFLLVVFGMVYYFAYCFDPFALDEDRILTETRKAYQEAKFKNEAFLKGKEIQDFVEFLLRHRNEIMNYNRHDEPREIQLAENLWTGYENKGNCFTMPTFYRSFINDYIPPELIDSCIIILMD